ncbi:hypothetical protein DS745_07605 [Anaerobacillus alkaliphilus]|uniref:Uncharacterized protein n=1 Tax=Anaerobacillus alkaliphilus TaxID=1548597 RepID=A0A4Q0VX78_9BACI|nr:S8 family serine peptidase [Anaerobacillus alkaliphilus]RXJ02245.1 hypothetical protein DS745_07605 [Anaerobacillus alkaliphilus]
MERKIFIVLNVFFLVLSSLLPSIAYTYPGEDFSDFEMQVSDEIIPPDSVEGGEVILPVPKISFGPHHIYKDSLRAYEPFKENENSRNKELESYSFKEDTLLVKIEPQRRSRGGSYTTTIDLEPFKQYGVLHLEPLFSQSANEKLGVLSSDVKAVENLSKWHRASLEPGSNIGEVIEELSGESNILAVEPDFIRKIDKLEVPDNITDPKVAEQWYLDKSGIKEAWNYLEENGMNSGGNRDIVVAIIDTGIDYKHPDLVGNMWVNSSETRNGQDNDGNSFRDDIHGANFVARNGDPMDDHGHGTHVAGIIAAQANNDIGGVGIAHNVQIMALKAAQSSGILASSDIAAAIFYAVDKGADIINMSFGGYGRSTLEEDALQVAFGTSVLVASAGNHARPNLPHLRGANLYPAAYPWVLGVMAERQHPAMNGDYLAGFSNWDTVPQNSSEYEIMAPGVEIFSTLPNNQYAKWSGTSMSAPVVSAIAALVRSKFNDKEMYSSRFIMGQIASTGDWKQGITPDPMSPPIKYRSVNAYEALTNTPKPELSYVEHYIFDTPNIAEGNDGNGVVDAGETIDIALVIRNHWGKADNVEVKIDTKVSSAGLSSPYATIINDTVNYGAIGNFGTDDNGLIYENDVVVGVNNPFKIKIAADTPNDYIIPINVTMTARNGFDANDTQTYTYQTGIRLAVRKGTILPGVIDKDMTLTKDNYWIVPNATLIREGATVTVLPGTQIQFWSSEPEDPYAEKTMAYIEVRGKFLVNGTAEDPVEMFASSLFPGHEVKVYSTESLRYHQSASGRYRGYAELNYTKVMNPNIAVQKIDHSYFSQDLFNMMFKRFLENGVVGIDIWHGPYVHSEETSNSIFYNLGTTEWYSDNPSISWMLRLRGKLKGNLFDSNFMYFDTAWAEDNVFLKNYKLKDQQYGDRTYFVSRGKQFGSRIDPNKAFQTVFPIKSNLNGSTYFAVRSNITDLPRDGEFQLVQRFAKEIGGHIVTIDDAEENQFIMSYLSNYLQDRHLFESKYPEYNFWDFYQDPVIGLNDFEEEGIFEWINGEEVNYTNWKVGEPDNKYGCNGCTIHSPANYVSIDRNSGQWYDYSHSNGMYIIEVPGVSYVTGITLNTNRLILGEGGVPAQLAAKITPEKATNQRVNWSSSDTDVASVDDNGLVTPLEIGKATITATTEDGGFIATVEVDVIEVVPVVGVTLNKQSLELASGEQETLVATVLPIGATDKTIEWASSNPDIVSVDQNGRVTGISEGTATILVTTRDGSYTAEAVVSVVVPVNSIRFDQTFLRLVLGSEPTQLTPVIQPGNSSNQSLLWFSSNEAVVSVDQNGLVSARGVGTALVTATNQNGAIQADAIVTVWESEISFNTKKVDGGDSYSIALNGDGTVWTWGDNEYGQLGDNTNSRRSTPIQVRGLVDIIDVSAGGRHSLALRNDGSVWVWGHNNYGQLGNGRTWGIETKPIQVDIDNVKKVYAGESNSFVLRNDGTVWAWGENYYGQLGDGSKINRSFPVQVENLTDVIEMSLSPTHTAALRSDGTVWMWGNNSYNQLGDGTKTDRLIPVQVKNISEVNAVTAGYNFTLALKKDGTLWGWGQNNFGAIGYGQIWDQFSSPVKININNVESVVTGIYHSIAKKSDGTVWAWGYNEAGQLGDGTYTIRDIPTNININKVGRISAGNYHNFLVGEAGEVYSWGQNNNGQLGDLTTINRNIPVQTLFGILPDMDEPTIVSVEPKFNAINVPQDANIKFIFNEVIQPGDNYGLIRLKDQQNNIISLKSRKIEGTKLIIEPLGNLKGNTTYTLQIPQNAVKDLFHNQFSNAYNLSFSTEQETKNDLNLVGLLRKEGYTVLKNTLAFNESVGITREEIDKIRIEFIESGALSTIQNNAILNRWWDPNVNNWMRFISEEGGEYKRYLSFNYWGTNSTTLIDRAIVDFNDFKNMEEVVFNPILTKAPEKAYPFVTDIYVSTKAEERTTRVGAEEITVNVLFNRDMEQTVQPRVSFGPDMPTTDYTVNPVNGGWISPRHWQGDFRISSLTGDGYQFFRVQGAVAADNPWLVTGNDSERFRFEIITSGTEAMNLQAVGNEGKVTLTWTQDDFDLLAGYNLYRSNTLNGNFEKVNTTVIPSDQKSYDDTNVEPGKTYYYKFTVVKTDLSESEYSNTASATPIDTVPPVVSHTAITNATANMSLQIHANVTDNVRVENVQLFYRKIGTTTYTARNMVKTTGDRYAFTLEGTIMQAPGIEYYIEATDGISIVRHGRPEMPHKLIINDAPRVTSVSPAEGPASGGTVVTINGSNFKSGAKVSFGQVNAENVEVESSNRIKVVSPAHIPATVNITVTNSDGSKHSLLGAYKYVSDEVNVSLPDSSANVGHIIEVPILISSVSGLRAVDTEVIYDSSMLELMNVRLGTITPNFSLATNTAIKGSIKLSMASATAVSGTGSLAIMEFKVLDSDKTNSALTISSLKLNDGNIKTAITNGNFNLANTFSVKGTVRYYSNNLLVPDVDLTLTGNKDYETATTSNGSFSLDNVISGAYQLKANRTKEEHRLSSYDASLILQAAVGLISLTENQRLAADVDQNGRINSMDAAYVLEKAVGLLEGPFPGSGKVWAFTPSERTYNNINSNLNSQNFTAVMLGDVSGSWGNSNQANLSSLFSLGQPITKEGNISIPVKFNIDETKLYGSNIVLKYDRQYFKAVSVEKTNNTSNYSFAFNVNKPGEIHVGLAGTEAISGEGEVFNIVFEPTKYNRLELTTMDLNTLVSIDNVQINDIKTTSVSLDSQLYQLTVGQTQKMKVTASYSDDSIRDVTSAATITTSNETIVDVVGGVLTAKNPGRAIITVAYGGEEVSVRVVVNSQQLNSTEEFARNTLRVTDAINRYGNTVQKVSVDSSSFGKDKNNSVIVNYDLNLLGDDNKGLMLEIPASSLVNNSDNNLNLLLNDFSLGLPLSLINFSKVSKELNADLEKISIVISIDKVEGEVAENIEQLLRNNRAKALINPLSLRIHAQVGQKRVEILLGDNNISSTLQLDQVMSQNKAVALLYEEKGSSLRSIPAKFETVAKETDININRLGQGIVVIAEHSKSFSDVDNHFAKSSIDLLASKFIINGKTETRFAPEDSITRAEFAALLVRALNISEKDANVLSQFKDVKKDQWFAGYIGAAYNAGIINGKSKDYFAPNEFITNAEMAVMISRVLKFLGEDNSITTEEKEELLASYKDYQLIPKSWAQTEVAELTKLNIHRADLGDNYEPFKKATRGQSATMLHGLLRYLGYDN